MNIWLAPAAYAPNRGGIEELTAQLARQLTSRGHEVVVIVNRWPGDAPESEILDGAPVERFDFAAPGRSSDQVKRFALSLPRNLKRLRALKRPDLIHIQGGASQLAHLTAFAQLSKVPMVLTTQGEVVMDAGQIYQRSVYQRLSLRAAAAASKRLIACSAWTRDQTAPTARRFATADVVPNAIAVGDWSGMPAPPLEPVFAAWGRHVQQKGFKQLLDAFAIVHQEIPHARLLLGGNGSETESLKREAVDGVEFLGGLDRAGVKDMLGRARVAVVPSLIEPFGIVALEALAAGRTLVHSGVGGLPEAAGPHGLIADVNDPRAFADTLIQALAHAPEVTTTWLQAHDWATVTDQYEAIYRDVLASRG